MQGLRLAQQQQRIRGRRHMLGELIRGREKRASAALSAPPGPVVQASPRTGLARDDGGGEGKDCWLAGCPVCAGPCGEIQLIRPLTACCQVEISSRADPIGPGRVRQLRWGRLLLVGAPAVPPPKALEPRLCSALRSRSLRLPVCVSSLAASAPTSSVSQTIPSHPRVIVV